MAKKVSKKVAPASIKKASTNVALVKATPKKQTLADIEKTLWAAADKLRVNMDAAEYKHVVLGLIFLKYVSDSFDEFRTTLKAQFKNPKHSNYFKGATDEALEDELEDRDYYTANNIFWVPIESRWFGNEVTGAKGIQDQAKSTKIGTIIDDAMAEIEIENPKLKNILPKDFARRQPNIRLGELVDLISTIGFNDKEMHSKDVLGHVYEYFLGQFASAEGKKGGQFYTPKSVVNLIVECLEPYEGRVYDPAMGSGGFFVSSEKFIEMHSDKDHVNDAKKKISIYGQESNPTTWRLAAMNMAIRGMDFNFGKEPADTFSKNQHPDLKADFIMANPPFNIKDWGAAALAKDRRWQYGAPPEGNANFAWVQHMIHHLGPKGYAGIVLANGSLSSNKNNEGDIRKSIIEAGLVDCIIALPGQLFSNTPIQACIWILSNNRKNNYRANQVLLIDARSMGKLVSNTRKELSQQELEQISETYKQWKKSKNYLDLDGYCKSVSKEDVEEKNYNLTPSAYIPKNDINDENIFDIKITLSKINKNSSINELLETQIITSFNKIGIEFEKIRINETLKDLLGEICNSWFIEFSPTNAKRIAIRREASDEEVNLACIGIISLRTTTDFLEENYDDEIEKIKIWIETLSKESKKNLINLSAKFPKSFDKNGIPLGWTEDNLLDLCDLITKGTTPTDSDISQSIGGSDTSFLKVKDVTDLGLIQMNKIEKIPRDVHDSKLKRSKLFTNDIICSIAGTIGRISIIPNILNDSNCNQALALCRLKNKKNHLYVAYYQMVSQKTQDYFYSSIIQGVQANISLKNVNEVKIINPSDDIIEIWNDLAAPVTEGFLKLYQAGDPC